MNAGLSEAYLMKSASYQLIPFKDLPKDFGALKESKVHCQRFAWAYVANIVLAFFLLAAPSICPYQNHALLMSDIACGVAVIFIEAFAFFSKCSIFRWGIAAVAVWTLLAPFLFWCNNAAVFATETMVSILWIAFAVILPGIPGRDGMTAGGPDQPPGWTYNPSSWIRRWLGIALGLLGFFISRHLAAHQLGLIEHAWDPFFGDGSDLVTGSELSRSFPISDAGLGSVAYIMEVMTGFLGDRARWRTAPWTVLLSAALVLPLGATSVVLVVLQPVVVGAWCGLCLVSAVGLLLSVPLAVHELVAVGQLLQATKKQEKDVWDVFWNGASIVGAGRPDPDRTHYSFKQVWNASVQGVTVPLSLILSCVAGIWLMARPDVLPSGAHIFADLDHLFGAVVLTIAAISTAEVTRIARFANLVVGFGLFIVAACALSSSLLVAASDIFAGALVMVSSVPRGEIVERYAKWNKFII